jgi:NifB/MoaA-like Fe-S oxidoreductase
MVRDFLGSGVGALPRRLASPRRVLCATGRLFAPVLREALASLAAVEGLEVEVRAITNRTFGAVTTVAGLLAGRDLLTQIEPGEADLVLISPSMLKYGTETFLDDRTLGEVAEALRIPVVVGGRDLHELVATILGGEGQAAQPQFGFSTHAVKEAARQH